MQLKTLHQDPLLSHVPLVGVAMALDDSEKRKRDQVLRVQPRPASTDGEYRVFVSREYSKHSYNL